MKNQQLKIIRPVLELMERMSRGEVPFEEGSGKGAGDARESAAPVMLDRQRLTHLRVETRKLLVAVRSRLAETMTERECYLALFPIVVCIDELVQTRYAGVDQSSWPLLQGEFFKVDQGGELFYASVDDILDAGGHSTLIYEIFYFCLALGFKGKLLGDEDRIASYMKRLAAQLPAATFGAEAPSTLVSGAVKPVISPWWFYLGAALIVAAFYLLFSMLADEPDDIFPPEPSARREPASPAFPGPTVATACPAPHIPTAPAALVPDPAGGEPEEPAAQEEEPEGDEEVEPDGYAADRADPAVDEDEEMPPDQQSEPEGGEQATAPLPPGQAERCEAQSDHDPDTEG